MINLEKGQRVNVDLPKFTIGLGWDTNDSSTGEAFDLDASVFILGENRKLLNDNYFVFYNNLKSPDEAVEHTGVNFFKSILMLSSSPSPSPVKLSPVCFVHF